MDIVFLSGLLITAISIVPVVLQLRRHPRGLRTLFFVEMWERFSYYGMRGLLIFFMTQHFLFDDAFASGQYAAYTSLVYLLPLIGGVLADRFIGTRKAIAFGAILLVVGYFAMCIEGPPAQQVLKYRGQEYAFDVQGRMEEHQARIVVDGQEYEFGASADGGLEIMGLPKSASLPSVVPRGSYELTVRSAGGIYNDIFYLALALIVMGVGFLKPNISAIVGQLYEQGDPRRDSGFTLYYYGISLGALWAAFVCGWLGTNVGWWAGFGAAGVGVALGYVAFTWGTPSLEGRGEPTNPEMLSRPLVTTWMNLERLVYIFGLVGVAVVWIVIQQHAWVGQILGTGSVLALAYLSFIMARHTWTEVRRMLLALILVGTSVVFWTLFEQAGSALNQFTQRNTILSIGELPVTAAQTQSFNAGFLLLLAPAFSALWAYLGRFNLNPSPAFKFGIALVMVGAGFFVLVWGAQFADQNFRIPLIFLALAYLLHTTGELCLSPIGLSQMTKLAPVGLVSTVMATWFLASSWAQYLGGMVAQLTAAETVAGQVLDPAKALQTYVSVFQMIGSWGVAFGAVLVLLSPALNLLSGEARRADTWGLRESVGGGVRTATLALWAATARLMRAAPSAVALGGLALLFVNWPDNAPEKQTNTTSAAMELARDGNIFFREGAQSVSVRSLEGGAGTHVGDSMGPPVASYIDDSNRVITVDETGFVRRSRLQFMLPDFRAGAELIREPGDAGLPPVTRQRDAATPTRTAPQPRIALVIGNGAYYDTKVSSLATPVNDARLIAETLRRAGFTVTELVNADRNAMRRSIVDLANRLRSAGESTVGFFYYAGHGLQSKVGDKTWLIPVDAQIELLPIDRNVVDVSEVLAQMKTAGNATNVIVLDACRSPAVGLARWFRRGLGHLDVPSRTFLAFSASPDQVAEDGDGPNSTYTAALAAEITRGGEIEDVFKRVRMRVAARGVQTPWEISALVNGFTFADRGVTLTEP